MKKKYAVTVNAFDRTTTRIVWAESDEEAQDRVLDEVHFKVKIEEVGAQP